MKIKDIPGEYFAMAFIVGTSKRSLCNCFHSSLQEAKGSHKEFFRTESRFGLEEFTPEIEWPVEIVDGIAYVPGDEELKNED